MNKKIFTLTNLWLVIFGLLNLFVVRSLDSGR